MATRQTNQERFWLFTAPALGLLAVIGVMVGCTTGGSHKSSSPVAVNAMRVLRDNCLACHAEEKHKGGLTLSGGVSISTGGAATKTGAGTLTISGAQNHGAGAALVVSQGHDSVRR